MKPTHSISCLWLRLLLVGAAAAAVSGCIWPFARGGGEPRLIIVRNACGVGLVYVKLRDVDPPHGHGLRMGMVSPVPLGTSQVFVRKPDPPPLPKEVVVGWKDDFGREHSKRVPLTRALRRATGRRGETLVFEIRPDGQIAVLLDTVETQP